MSWIYIHLYSYTKFKTVFAFVARLKHQKFKNVLIVFFATFIWEEYHYGLCFAVVYAFIEPTIIAWTTELTCNYNYTIKNIEPGIYWVVWELPWYGKYLIHITSLCSVLLLNSINFSDLLDIYCCIKYSHIPPLCIRLTKASAIYVSDQQHAVVLLSSCSTWSIPRPVLALCSPIHVVCVYVQ